MIITYGNDQYFLHYIARSTVNMASQEVRYVLLINLSIFNKTGDSQRCS